MEKSNSSHTKHEYSSSEIDEFHQPQMQSLEPFHTPPRQDAAQDSNINWNVSEHASLDVHPEIAAYTPGAPSSPPHEFPHIYLADECNHNAFHETRK